MSSTGTNAENLEELDALFDSIVANGGVNAEDEVAVPAPVSDMDGEKVAGSTEKVLTQVGNLTRTLHESLCALGYDKIIEKTASEIPDARDRLAYVVTMTEQAAQRALNATDIAKPIQDQLAVSSTDLSAEWNRLFARQMDIAGFKELVTKTRDFLGEVPKQTAITNAQLMEIMMAQDFQDLTGQVIKKATEIIQMVEHELLRLLVENVPQGKRTEAADGLLNGPVINADGRNDVVTSQVQVDDLLESLGF